MEAVQVAATGFILLVACFGILFRKLVRGNRHAPAFSDANESLFSQERYREMERLLDVKLSFQQSGSTYKLRKERADVLLSYIQQLSYDFHSIRRALKLVMVHSQVDRPDLASALMKQQALFTFTILAVKFKLVLFRLGWNGVKGDTLTTSLRSLCLQLQILAAIAQPEAAYY